MKTFTIKRDQVSEGICVYLGDNNDYYIRLSNSSYPEKLVRRYLNRNSPPEIKNNFVYDLDIYKDPRSGRSFLCKPKSIQNNFAIVLLKHNRVDNLKNKYIVYRENELPYMLIMVPVNHELFFIQKEDDDTKSHYRVYLDRNLNLNSVQILK